MQSDDREQSTQTDFRQYPEAYRIGRGEEGVLSVEPYKSELLPHWRFRTPAIAHESARQIYALFETYRSQEDFVGMDMARKFLQMGFTRARRYARHKSGRKWSADRRTVLPIEEDPEKAHAAEIFREMWKRARTDPVYLELKRRHQARRG